MTLMEAIKETEMFC